MALDITFTAHQPQTLSATERHEFCELVRDGGEIPGKTLKANVKNSRILVRLINGDKVCGASALKRPRDSYRRTIAKKTGFALYETDFPFELGYIYIHPSLRGRGHTNGLLKETLDHNDGLGVWATVRVDNAPMRAALARVGFEAAGKSYAGAARNGQAPPRLDLLVRPPPSVLRA